MSSAFSNAHHDKALSLRTSGVVYFCRTGGVKSDYEVVDADTGEVTILPPRQFESMYVPEWKLPPHMRHITQSAFSWWDWKARRRA